MKHFKNGRPIARSAMAHKPYGNAVSRSNRTASARPPTSVGVNTKVGASMPSLNPQFKTCPGCERLLYIPAGETHNARRVEMRGQLYYNNVWVCDRTAPKE